MCDCIIKIAKTTLDHITGQTEGRIDQGHIKGIGYSFNGGATTTSSEYEFQHTPRKKDGTLGRPRTQSVLLIHTYCPWCGEKFAKGADLNGDSE